MLDEVPISPSPAHERLVRAFLDNPSLIQNDDLVSPPDRRHAMGDNDQRAAGAKRVYRLLNCTFADAIQLACRFIEDQDLGVGQDGPCHCDTLLLPAGEPNPRSPNNV